MPLLGASVHSRALPQTYRALLWKLHCSASHCYDLPLPRIVSLCLCPAPHFNDMQTDAFATRFDDSLRPCFAKLRDALLRSAFAEPRARSPASPTLRPSLPFSAEPCSCSAYRSKAMHVPRGTVRRCSSPCLCFGMTLFSMPLLCFAKPCRAMPMLCRSLLCRSSLCPCGANVTMHFCAAASHL